MRETLIAFRSIMVVFFLGAGGILVFTNLVPQIQNNRILLGTAMMLYGSYRLFTAWRDFIRK